jgi:hypothetical protein
MKKFTISFLALLTLAILFFTPPLQASTDLGWPVGEWRLVQSYTQDDGQEVTSEKTVVPTGLDMNKCAASFLNEIGLCVGCRPVNRSPPVTDLNTAAGIGSSSGNSPTTLSRTPAKDAT